MNIIRVCKEFSFEMAHALYNYDGPCRNVHGHSYRLYVTVTGVPADRKDDPKLGMVIDFGDLKQIVKNEIVDQLDHSVVLSTLESEENIAKLRSVFGNMVLVDYQPTCENLVTDFARRIRKRLPEGVSLHSIRLHETATSYAEWHASDNL